MIFNKSIIGIDIGSIKTKLVQVKYFRGKYKLVDFISIATPPEAVENGFIIQPELLGEKLGEVIRKHNLHGAKVIAAVSGSQIYIKNIILPKLKLKELRQAAYYEAAKFLPIPLDEAIIDVFPLQNIDTEEGVKTQLFFAATRKRQVSNLEECLEIAGLNIKAIDLEPLALNRILIEPKNYAAKGIINIGANRSCFYVFEGDNLLFHRPFTMDDELHFDDGKANDDYKKELYLEVLRSIEYFDIQFQYIPGVLLLCGYCSQLTELKDWLNEKLKIPIEIGRLNENIIRINHLSEEEQMLIQYEFLTALGLAIREGA